MIRDRFGDVPKMSIELHPWSDSNSYAAIKNKLEGPVENKTQKKR